MHIHEHYIAPDKIHTLTISATSVVDSLSTRYIAKLLTHIDETHIPENAQRLRIILDVSDFYLLPLRNMALQLREFYEQRNVVDLSIALVVQPTIASVLTTLTRTYVKCDSIQLFTQLDKADLWLKLQDTPPMSA